MSRERIRPPLFCRDSKRAIMRRILFPACILHLHETTLLEGKTVLRGVPLFMFFYIFIFFYRFSLFLSFFLFFFFLHETPRLTRHIFPLPLQNFETMS